MACPGGCVGGGGQPICDGKELAVHADIEDENQTVKVKVPEIGTQATVDGKKEITASGRVKIEDTVSYKNLTPGKEYTVKGVLMNKATGEPLLADGKTDCNRSEAAAQAYSGKKNRTLTKSKHRRKAA